MLKKKWKLPELEVLDLKETMASKNWGAYDEGYNEALGEEGQIGIHHGS
ncbi:paeninodin family lasso peptide [Sutcliffiella horikoshii]|uniref:Paeninodin family lasso peptide n=1 Tax=Sutcliffiella horikoshii TaxID=79883 RepID=A0AA94WPP4_9BACI|nr:paeninodin family lasso peptide [Sutcliffiella horikoshii]TYS60088.1 paeninodin family lasso peptide [Sutcliffiella horikoshii]